MDTRTKRETIKLRPHHLPVIILGAFGHIRAPDQFFYEKLRFRGLCGRGIWSLKPPDRSEVT